MISVPIDKIRVGIIGLGGIATRMHIPALSILENVEIAAGAEINPQQAERTQERFGIPRIYRDYSDMFAAEQLDAVYICLPSFLHYDAVRTALDLGVHVLCEKPMGLSAGQAHELVCKAEQDGLVLVPGYQLRFNSNYLRGKQLIGDRRLGKILQLQGVIANPGPYAGWDPKSDWYYDARGCGVLYDLGCHVIDLLLFLSSLEITEVYARSAISLPGLEVPDCIVALLSTDTYPLCSLNLGWSTGTTFDMIQVHGTAGSLLVSTHYFEYLPPETGGFQRLNSLWSNARGIFASKIDKLVKGYSASDGVAISRCFVDAIAGKGYSLDNARDAVKVLAVLDAMKESLGTGRPVRVRRFGRTAK